MIITKEKALELIQLSIDELSKSGMFKNIKLDSKTVILGAGSFLDSLGFVSFISDVEEKIIDETDKDVYISLDGIQEYCGDSLILTADLLSGYLTTLKEE